MYLHNNAIGIKMRPVKCLKNNIYKPVDLNFSHISISKPCITMYNTLLQLTFVYITDNVSPIKIPLALRDI